MTIYYFFDTYCGWCYGFDKAVSEFLDRMPDDLDICLVSGGLFTGDRIAPISAYGYIKAANQQIADVYGVTFGDAYNDLFDDDSQLMDSAHPASGLALVRPHLTGKEFVRFAIALQKAFYQDGADLSKPDVYLTLAQAFGVADKVSKEEVAQALVDKTLASADFDFTAKCGIQSYPTFLLNKGDKWYDLRGQASSGEELFANYQYLLELDK